MRRMQCLAAVILICLAGNPLPVAASASQPPALLSQAIRRLEQRMPPLSRGVVALLTGHYDKTIAICDTLLHDDADNQRACVLRGYAHLFKRGAGREAIADFSAALRCDDGSAIVQVARAQAYYQQKDYDRAIADCTRALRLDAHCLEGYVLRADCYQMKKVSGKSIADYTAALRLDPHSMRVLCRRGVAYLFQYDYVHALADAHAVLRGDPNHRLAQILRYAVSFLRQDFDRAIADAGEFIRRHPTDAQGYSLRFWAYLARGEVVKSFCDATVTLLLTRGGLWLQLRRHSLTFALAPSSGDYVFAGDGDCEERIAACTQRLQDDPANVAAYYERAYAYLSRRDYKPALNDFDRIVRLDPSDAEALRSRGGLSGALGAYAKALDDSNQAMQLDPKNVNDYAGRARAYAGMKKWEEALQDCAAALAIDSGVWQMYELRGWIYLKVKAYDRAVEDYSSAIWLCPNNPALYRGRAEARGWMWNCAGVIDDYQESVKREPSNVRGRARLAWCLSTCPDARLRNGPEARKWALAACRDSSWHNAEALTCLAAACAECRDFDAAVKWQSRAGELLPDSAQAFSQHCLQLYREHKPYHDSLPRRAAPPASSVGGMGGYSGRRY